MPGGAPGIFLCGWSPPLRPFRSPVREELKCSIDCAPVSGGTGSRKAALMSKPTGVLLITPESLEAILVRRGAEALGLFQAVGWVVIDELHAYLDSPRGKQLQSLLHRIETVAQRRMQRIGLRKSFLNIEIATVG